MQTEPLTSDRIYAYIAHYIEAHGYSPTIRDIASACQLGKSTAHYHVEKLVALGWLEHKPGAARSLRIVRDHIVETSSKN
jgi:repressor LexA